jgi:anti-sigma-K factor RskA
MIECRDLREHYEAFALGVLEGEEQSEIQAHLARQCPACTLGVKQSRVLASQLAHLAPEVEPPARVRRKLLEAVAERPARRGWLPVWAWATATAFVVLVASLAVQLLRNFQEVRALQSQLAQLEIQYQELSRETDLYRRALAIAASPDSRAISLTSAQPATPQIRAYWNEALGLVLSAQQMPAPEPDRTFQLWVVPRQGNPINAGIFRPDPTGRVLIVSTPTARILDAAALAISDEPSGGSPQPTTTPIWVGPLS